MGATMDNDTIRTLAAAQVVATCEAESIVLQHGEGLTARELNALVASYPPPSISIERMGLDAGDVPILFVDIGFGGVIDLLQSWMTTRGMPFPVFYMPTGAMDAWAQADGVPEFMTWLRERGFELQLNIGGSATWLRGHWVFLVDVRLRFLESVPQGPLIEALGQVLQIGHGEG